MWDTARFDGLYSDGRRPDTVRVGTLLDDLARRDFTVNAIAYDEETGTYIDPHGGQGDIKRRLLRCVGKASDRFNEDALRLLRAVRFVITKSFIMDDEIRDCLQDPTLVRKLRGNVAEERKREELHKCFAHDTLVTLTLLEKFPELRDACFRGMRLWLMPTMREA